MSKTRVAFFAVLLGLFSLAGAAAAGDAAGAAARRRIGISIPTADHGWTGGVNYWARRAADEWQTRDPGLEFTLVAAAGAEAQTADIENLLTKGIDALVVLPLDSAPLTPVVKKVRAAGVYVVSVDRGLTEPVENVYIAGDNPGMGSQSALWLGREMGGKGSLVMLEGIPGPINTERVDGFRSVMAEKFPDIKILDSKPANWDRATGLRLMEEYLQKYPRLDAVYAQDDDVLAGVLQAYRESGRHDIRTFVGGGGAKTIIKRIMDSDPLVRATVTYPPDMIATGVSLAVWALRGDDLAKLLGPDADLAALRGFYQRQRPRVELPPEDGQGSLRVILASELVTATNAEQYYLPDSPF